MLRDGRQELRFYGTAAVVLAVDQVTKFLARRFLDYDRPVTVIPGFFDLKLSYNRGAAFGLLPDWAPLLILIALIVIYAIVRLRSSVFASSEIRSRTFSIALGLLLGGAAGNLIDRLTSPSQTVTDFISLYIIYHGEKYAWPTFNIADVAIVVGALMLFFFYGVGRRESREPEIES